MVALELKKCIGHWERTLFHDKALLSPDMRVIIESTLAHLQELEKIKEKEG